MHFCRKKDRAVVLVSTLCMCVCVRHGATMHRDLKHQTENDVAHSQSRYDQLEGQVVLMVARMIAMRAEMMIN